MKLNNLANYTFKDSGKTVQVRRISPFLAMQVQKSTPKPKPPMNKVDYGDGVVKEEPNEADPVYQQSITDWNNLVEYRTRKLIVDRAVVFEMDDEKREEVSEARKWLEDNHMVTEDVPTDDKEFWLTMCAIGSPEDLQDLMNFVTRRSQPTPEEIATAKDTFRR